jgi:peptidoglycan/xylan/chitin deacetylase (PgdA/CDA1 family)
MTLPRSSRARLLGFLSRLLHWSGLLALARPLVERTRLAAPGPSGGRARIARRPSPNAQILVYHRVNEERDPYFAGLPPDVFDRQMEYVASRFHVLPLRELVAALQARALPSRAVAVTFDDGYRDNFLHAFPILRRHAIPATVFLATSAIGTGAQLWHDDVFSAFRETKAARLDPFGPRSIAGPLDTVPQRLGLQREVLGYLRTLPDEARAEEVGRLREALRVGAAGPVPGLMLTWEEARTMSGGGIQFGSHTVSHPLLSRVGTERARREIVDSKRAIEEQLDVAIDGFAYPNGRATDFLPETRSLLLEAGYTHAVTTIAGSNDETTDPFGLRRETPWDEDVFAFGVRMVYNKWRS